MMTKVIDQELLDSEKIIAAIEQFPCIYNTSDPQYKTVDVKAGMWKNVFREVVGEQHWDMLNHEERVLYGKEIQKRWKNIRDSYKKSLAEIQKPLKCGKPKKPYIHHKRMSFLKDFMDHQPTESNFSIVNEESLTEVKVGEPPITIAKVETLMPSGQLQASEVRKRKLEERLELETVFCDSVGIQQQHSQQQTQQNLQQQLLPDHDSMFLQSLVPHLKSLSREQKLDFQIRTLQLIQSYNYNRSSSSVVAAGMGDIGSDLSDNPRLSVTR